MKLHEISLSKNLKAILEDDKIILVEFNSKRKVKNKTVILYDELDKLNTHTKYLRKRLRQGRKEMIF